MRRTILTLLFLTGTAAAGALDISPDVFYFRGKSGEKIKKVVQFKNNGSQPVSVSLEFKNESPGGVEKSERGKRWLGISNQKFVLKPNQSGKVKFHCRVPPASGQVQGTLSIRTVEPPDSLFEVWMDYPVLVQVQGTEVAECLVESLYAEKRGENVVLEGLLKNKGNIRLTPKMVAEIESEDGKKVSQILVPKSRFIQPNENANFSTIIPLNENVFSRFKGHVSVFFYDGEGSLKTVQAPFEVRAQ